jgi:hypothetical protein
MLMRTKWIAIAVFLLVGAPFASPQAKRGTETHNAALRYWMAFAELQDPPSDKGTAELLEKTAASEAPWDETKLGPILDKNEEAILLMQRATKLPECDWGLEYGRGSKASIAYVPRARVLARLNTLYGMRLAANGKTQDAIDSWLAGVRFSQHLTHGGGLIFALIGKMTLLSNLHALTQSAQAGLWSNLQRKRVEDVIHVLPETGFDWAEALWYEQAVLEQSALQMSQADDPTVYYKQMMGHAAPADFEAPRPSDTVAFDKLMSAAQAALRLPPDQAQTRLTALQDSVKNLQPFYRETAPSLTRINDSRAEVQAAREKLLHTLSPG